MRYHPDLKMITWHPSGILDNVILDQIFAFIQMQDQVAGAPPFNRFVDLSGLSAIRLELGHMFDATVRHRERQHSRELVKSAIFCDKVVGLGIAKMYETLMKGSSLQVQAFSERGAAAGWLGVPLEHLLDK